MNARWLTILTACCFHLAARSAVLQCHWLRLPSIPDREGFAAPFTGVSGGALLVAGGANFPGRKPWEGGTKVWHDTVFILEKPDGEWRAIGRLPRALGYGVGVSAEDSLFCFGGSNDKQHYAEGFRLTWHGNRLTTTPLPPLPASCAHMSWALAERSLYVIGGTAAPDSIQCLQTFWRLDLDKLGTGWRVLDPCPGPARMLAVAGAVGRDIYLFSGASLYVDSDGKPKRDYLRDAWRYSSGTGWTALATMPRAAVASPSPAPVADGQLLVCSGDDGSKAGFQPMDKHPGFGRDVLGYDPAKNLWRPHSEAPFSRATVPVAQWKDLFIIPNGEARPGVRSPEVWTLRVKSGE